jgi:hypothetical protein
MYVLGNPQIFLLDGIIPGGQVFSLNTSLLPGADVMNFKYFRQKMAKKLAFLTQNKAKLCTHLIITLVFEKNANFSAENRRKL